jgi:tetratricopeptide (TPR) repeat protein
MPGATSLRTGRKSRRPRDREIVRSVGLPALRDLVKHNRGLGMGRFKWLEFDEKCPNGVVSAPEDEGVDEATCVERGDRCFWEESYERALYHYSRALRYQINLEQAWVGQVRCLLALGEFHEANLWADRGLDRFPNSADLLAAKASATGRTRGTTAALRISDRALEADGGGDYVWTARGEILLLAHEEAAAARCFAKAVEIANKDWRCHYAIGRLLLSAGDAARALGYFTQAERCDGAQSLSMMGAADCYERMGEIDAAKSALYRALRLTPSDLALRERVKRLERIGPLRRLWRAVRRR